MRYFSKNADEYLVYVNCSNIKAEIMCFSETWFRQDSINEITGYNLFRICRNNVGMGGGISIYVGDKYKSVLKNDISFVSDIIEICSVEVTIGNESIFVIGIYHPPVETKLPQFNEILRDVLATLCFSFR